MTSKRSSSLIFFTLTGITALLVTAGSMWAEEQKGPELKGVTYFGGTGDQGAAQDGMGLAVKDKRLYLSGADLTLYGGQALVACYTDPPGTSPVWAFRWPNVRLAGWWNEETFPGIAVTHEGVYCAGRSWAAASDGVGGREGKAVLAKFPLNGPTGPGVGGALWIAKPLFFPYTGIETFFDVTLAQEGAQTFLYATGRGQSDGSNNTAVLAKFDMAGKLIWSKVLGRAESYVWSQGDTLAVLNGFVYVAGYAHWHKDYSSLGTKNPIRPHAALWKVDPAGNVVWLRESPQPISQYSAFPRSLTVLGDFLFVAAPHENGPNGGEDLLVLKYNEAGTLLSSWMWGGAKDDCPMAIAAKGNRLFVTGATTGWVGGGKDLFLLEMEADTGKVLSVDYQGGANDDVGYDLTLTETDLYIVGESKSKAQGGNIVGQADLMLLHYSLTKAPPIVPVLIDIKPRGYPNTIQMESKGNVPVAILSTDELDVTKKLDLASFTFGHSGHEKSLIVKQVKPEEVNGDGRMDLVAHFDTPLTAFQLEDTQGFLRGKTLTGLPILGIDSVRILRGKLAKERIEHPGKPEKPGQREAAGFRPKPPAAGRTPVGKQEPPKGELQ